MIDILRDVFIGVLYLFGIGFFGFFCRVSVCPCGAYLAGAEVMLEALCIGVFLTVGSLLLIILWEVWK